MERPIPTALAPFVSSWAVYHHELDPRAMHYGVPSPTATVIISFDEPLDVGWSAQPQSSRHWVLVSGLHSSPALIRTHGLLHGMQLALTPRGCRALLGVPIGAVAEQLVEDVDLPRPLLPGVHESLAAAPMEHRLALMERELTRRLADDEPVTSPEVGWAWTLLARTAGRISVRRLADEVGWSERRLRERFGAEMGLSPKTAARLHRFSTARQLAASGHPLAQVAARLGYADQAHLSREWRAFAGQSPRAEQEFVLV